MQTEIALTDTEQNTRESVNRAVSLLRSGEVVALPTETVYGLGADAFNAAAVARIFEATEGRSLTANIALVLNNARLAAQIARKLA